MTSSRRKPRLPIVLGIESATPSGGMALVDAERCLGSFQRWGGRLHSQRMMTGLRDLLRDLGLSPHDLAAVAVSIGPGSFTGVRVGLAAAKTLAHSLRIPILGVPTLEAFALRAVGVDADGHWNPGCTVCPLLDARRGELYWAAFRLGATRESDQPPGSESMVMRSAESEPAGSPAAAPSGGGWRGLPALRRLAPDAMTPAAEIGECLSGLTVGDRGTRTLMVCGDGAYHARAALEAALGPGLRFAPPHRMTPGPEEIAWLGLRRCLEGSTDDPLTLAPVYLRQPDVQFPRTLQRADTNPHGQTRTKKE
jgi:tRNA threonylcarbamoyladenosine biosynthesis protein TsaB